MYLKKGEVRLYVFKEELHIGKIIEVNENDNTYEIEEIETKEVHTVEEDNIYLGDD